MPVIEFNLSNVTGLPIFNNFFCFVEKLILNLCIIKLIPVLILVFVLLFREIIKNCCFSSDVILPGNEIIFFLFTPPQNLNR